MRSFLMLATAFVALAAAPDLARAEARNPNAIAVIIGNKNYVNHDIPAVKFADRDAQAIRNYAVDVLGYDPRNIIYLENATQSQMLKVFGSADDPKGQFARWLRPGGVADVLVYYSGHGVPSIKDAQSYLLPVDADPNSVTINGYALNLLYTNLQKLGAHSVTVLLDACFSGASAEGPLIAGASVMSRPASPAPAAGQAGGLTVLTASQADQVANWDGKDQHGLFTEYFLEAVYGGADVKKYGGQGDGHITLASVQKYLDDEMSYVAQREDGRDQNVTVIGEPATVLAMIVPGHPPQRHDYVVPAPVQPVIARPSPPPTPRPPPPAPPRPVVQQAVDPNVAEHQGEVARQRNDYQAAAYLFDQAAQAGSVRAMTHLGQLFNGGRPDMQPNYAMADYWFERAAAAGDREAMYEIGMMCKRGTNGPVNLERARYWFDQAAKRGDMLARHELNRL